MVMSLGPLRRKVDRRPFVSGGGKSVVNPAFRESHLANPVRCPSCGRTFYLFVGVEYDKKKGIRAVDVKPLPDTEETRELARWPHLGVVARHAIHYTPFRVAVYESLQDLEEALAEERGEEPAMVWSLPELGQQPRAPAAGGEGEGRRPQPMAVVEVDGGPPPGLG